VISGTFWLNFKYSFFNTKFYINLDTLGRNYAKGLSLGLITSLTFQNKTDTFLEKKRKKNLYKDFGIKDLRPQNKIQNQNSYFDEEEDPYAESSEEQDNSELREELQLLGE